MLIYMQSATVYHKQIKTLSWGVNISISEMQNMSQQVFFYNALLKLQ